MLGEGHGNKACEKVFQYLMKSAQCLIRDIVTDCFRGKLHGMAHTKGPLLSKAREISPGSLFKLQRQDFFIKVIFKNICLKWDSCHLI